MERFLIRIDATFFLWRMPIIASTSRQSRVPRAREARSPGAVSSRELFRRDAEDWVQMSLGARTVNSKRETVWSRRMRRAVRRPGAVLA